MRRVYLLCILIMMISVGLFAEKLATLPDIIRPFSLALDDQQIYISDGTTVYIYSRKDLTLKKKFGKAGDGPQEFRIPPGEMSGLFIHPQTDSLVINSQGKVSFFSIDGEYIKEIKSSSGMMGAYFLPIEDQFTGMAFQVDNERNMTLTVGIFDGKLTKIKEIYQQPFMNKGRMEFPIVTPIFYVVDNKIITSGGQKGFVINILDNKGNKLTSISREYKLLKVTDEYKKGIHDFFKNDPSTKPVYEGFFKNIITFSDEFPAIQIFFVDLQKIYIQTYLKKDGKVEFFIYDFKGKLVKELFLPVAYRNSVFPAPTAVKDNKLYQLVENEEEEVWELHAVKME